MAWTGLIWFAFALVSYLIGGIPTAYLAARLLKGEDIRTLGDHNVGAANVYRNISSWAGGIVAVVDIAKGAAAVLLVRGLVDSSPAEMIAGLAVVAGHNWSVYLGFRGGRGAATTVGVLLVMLPALAIPVGLLALVVLYFSKRAIYSLGFFLILTPILAWWPADYPYATASYSVAIPLMVGARHLWSVNRLATSKPAG